MSAVILIDLSSILHQHYHLSSEDPDPNVSSRMAVAKVRALASGQKHVAICCDVGPSFRRRIDPNYKGHRKAKEATLFHQMHRAAETLRGDGFPVWGVPDFEADDLIASATTAAVMTGPDVTVTIVSADKDLLQLVGERVSFRSVRTGDIVDAAGVEAHYGVKPSQMLDYLALVGDKADNIPGCNGVGEKRAALLLKQFGSLDGIYAAIYSGATPGTITPAIRTALKEFEPRVATVRELITLRTDVTLPMDELWAERVHADVAAFIEENASMDTTEKETAPDVPSRPLVVDAVDHDPDAGDRSRERTETVARPIALAVREPEVLPVAAEYERMLDPRSPGEARTVSADLFQARMFADYGSPQAILSTVMLGRELGMPAMASLRAVHVIEGKHSLSADTMVALVLKSGFAEYFSPVSFSDAEATFKTKRKGEHEEEVRFTFTVEDARRAGLVKDKSNWVKNPRAMCIARAKSALARLVFPDVVGGLYSPEELRDIRESEAA